MTNVYDLGTWRKKNVVPAPSTPSDVVAAVLLRWEDETRANNLNAHIRESLGMYAVDGVDYLSDYGQVAAVEQRLGLSPAVWGPGFLGAEQRGWRAGFRFGEQLVSTPDMNSEHHARCCSAIVFLKLKRAHSKRRD